jgi:O-phospho-L-seryl-tRNASec:L-selenocysteinyl-tRNA synthase
MGERGYRGLLKERQRVAPSLIEGLRGIAHKHGLSLLPSPRNSISFAVSIDNLLLSLPAEDRAKEATFIGSMLFQRSVSGCRVIPKTSTASVIGGHSFINWGSHSNLNQHNYFTVACSIGTRKEDIDGFLERLDKVIVKYKKRLK